VSRTNSYLWRPSPSLGRLAVRTLVWGGLGLGVILFLTWARWPRGITLGIFAVTVVVVLYQLVRALIDALAAWNAEPDGHRQAEPLQQ
jgi:hypothetical protein